MLFKVLPNGLEEDTWVGGYQMVWERRPEWVVTKWFGRGDLSGWLPNGLVTTHPGLPINHPLVNDVPVVYLSGIKFVSD